MEGSCILEVVLPAALVSLIHSHLMLSYGSDAMAQWLIEVRSRAFKIIYTFPISFMASEDISALCISVAPD